MPQAQQRLLSKPDGSRTIEYSEDDYHIHDNFFGGEPYEGRLTVFHKDQPVFLEVYYGRISRPANPVYSFLREALQHPGEDNPFLGSEEYKKDNLTYESTTECDVANYTVKENIYDGDEEIYCAVVIGGLVDQNTRGTM